VTTGFKVKATRVDTDAGTVVETVDLDAGVEDVDFRILAAAGVEVRHVLVEARYSHGLRSIVASAEASPAAQSLKNKAIEILVGVRF
jgi:hypothetical protein